MNFATTNSFRSNFYIPDKNKKDISESTIWKWYLNVETELQIAFKDHSVHDYFKSYYHEAGLLRRWRRPFFRHHFARTFAKAGKHIFSGQNNPLILDLGCGSGTQSLWFAIMGARVVAVDMDEKALGIFRQRKVLYEDLLDQELPISIYHEDIFKFDFGSIGPFNGIFSMFAFNMMQPSKKLLTILSEKSAIECRLVILDGNNRSWPSRYIPSRRRDNCLSPIELQRELVRNSFIIVEQSPGFCIPPLFWAFLPTTFLRKMDSKVGKNSFLAISYLTLAIKR